MKAIFFPILHVLAALTLSPLLIGIIHRTKAFFGGRRGRPLTQPYHDIVKLFRKGAVYSETTSWVFRAGPVIGLSAVGVALAVTPLGATRAVFPFRGDLVLFAYVLGLMRFVTVIAALDTGSAFEGMGASREVQFSALAEVALLIGLSALAVLGHGLSLTGLCRSAWTGASLTAAASTWLLVATAFLIVLLVENARIPFDDPNTHLELTMIHEVMILDHGGVDLGLIEYAGALKFWILGCLLVSMLLPVRTGSPALDFAAGLAGLPLLAVVVGVIESVMARLRLVRVPQLLVAACVLSFLAVIVAVR